MILIANLNMNLKAVVQIEIFLNQYDSILIVIKNGLNNTIIIFYIIKQFLNNFQLKQFVSNLSQQYYRNMNMIEEQITNSYNIWYYESFPLLIFINVINHRYLSSTTKILHYIIVIPKIINNDQSNAIYYLFIQNYMSLFGNLGDKSKLGTNLQQDTIKQPDNKSLFSFLNNDSNNKGNQTFGRPGLFNNDSSKNFLSGNTGTTDVTNKNLIPQSNQPNGGLFGPSKSDNANPPFLGGLFGNKTNNQQTVKPEMNSLFSNIKPPENNLVGIQLSTNTSPANLFGNKKQQSPVKINVPEESVLGQKKIVGESNELFKKNPENISIGQNRATSDKQQFSLFGNLVTGNTNINSKPTELNTNKPDQSSSSLNQPKKATEKILPNISLFSNNPPTNQNPIETNSLFSKPQMFQKVNQKKDDKAKNQEAKTAFTNEIKIPSIPNLQNPQKKQQRASTPLIPTTNLFSGIQKKPSTNLKLSESIYISENKPEFTSTTVIPPTPKPQQPKNINKIQIPPLPVQKNQKVQASKQDDTEVIQRVIVNKVIEYSGRKNLLTNYLNSQKIRKKLTFNLPQKADTIRYDFDAIKKIIPLFANLDKIGQDFLYQLYKRFQEQSGFNQYEAFMIWQNYFVHKGIKELMNEMNDPQFLADNYIFYYDRDGSMKLNQESQKIKKIFLTFLDEYISTHIAMIEALNLVKVATNKLYFYKLMTQDKLYFNLWQFYLKNLQKLEQKNIVVKDKEKELKNFLSFAFEAKLVEIQKYIIDFIANMTEAFRQSKLVEAKSLIDYVERLDRYHNQKNYLFTEDEKLVEIENFHQRVLLLLFQFDKVENYKSLKDKQRKQFIWNSGLLKTIENTKSNCFGPFRAIVSSIKKIIQNTEIDNTIPIDYKKVFRYVNHHFWGDWLDLYLMNEKAVNFEAIQRIIQSVQIIYSNNQNLKNLFKPEEEKFILKYIQNLKSLKLDKIVYRFCTILLGNQKGIYVDLVLKRYFNEKDLVSKIYKNITQKILKNISMKENDQVNFWKEIQPSFMFFLKILELCPQKAVTIQQYFVGNSPSVNIQDKMIQEDVEFEKQQIICLGIFLIESLSLFYNSKHANFKILKGIFKAINSLIRNKTTSNSIFDAIGLVYRFEITKGIESYYSYLEFFNLLQKYRKEPDAQELINEIYTHLITLIDYNHITRFLPTTNDEFKELNEDDKEVNSTETQINFENRYTDSYRSLRKQFIYDQTKLRFGSPWLSTICEIISFSDINFAHLSRILKKLVFIPKQTQQFEYVPYILQILINSVNKINVIQKIMEYLQVIDSSDFGNASASELYNIYFYREKKNGREKQARQKIHHALEVLQILLNFLYILRTYGNNPEFSNHFLIHALRNLFCLQSLEKIFLEKSSMYNYIEKINEPFFKPFNPIITLAAHINFQSNNNMMTTYNVTMKHYKQINWLAYQDQNQTDICLNELKKMKNQLDYYCIVNYLEYPKQNDFSGVDNISLNALRNLTLIGLIWNDQKNYNGQLLDYFVNERLQRHVELKRNILSILYDYNNKIRETIQIIQYFTILVKKNYKFIESYFMNGLGVAQETPERKYDVFTFLDNFFSQKNDNIELFVKIIIFIKQIYAKEQKLQAFTHKLFQKDYIMHIVLNLQAFHNFHESHLKFNDDTSLPLNLLSRIILEKEFYNENLFNIGVEKITTLINQEVMKGNNLAVRPTQIWISFLIQKKLFYAPNKELDQVSLITFESEQQKLKKEKFIFNCLMCENMRNFKTDPYQQYYINDMQFKDKSKDSIYLNMQKKNVIACKNQILINRSESVFKLLIFVLSIGKEGYIMSTLPIAQKNPKAEELHCYRHHNKLKTNFLDLFGNNQYEIFSRLDMICRCVLANMTRQKSKINYRLSVMLIADCLQMIKFSNFLDRSTVDLVTQLLNQYTIWISIPEQSQLVITTEITVKLLMELLCLHRVLNLDNKLLIPFKEIILKVFKYESIIKPELKNLLITQILYLIEIKHQDQEIQLICEIVNESNPNFFFNCSRVMLELARRYPKKLCELQIISKYINHPVLNSSSSIDTLQFYTSDQHRNQTQMCWIWILNIVKTLTIYSQDVVTTIQTLKFINFYKKRFQDILKFPYAVVTQNAGNVLYAYMEELQTILSLLLALFSDSANWVYTHRQLYESYLYILLHFTSQIFHPNFSESPFKFKETSNYMASSRYQYKLSKISFNKKNQKKCNDDEKPSATFTPKLSPIQNHARKRISTLGIPYETDMFSFSIEKIYFDIVNNYILLITKGFQQSVFVKRYFQSEIKGTKYKYNNLFWNNFNKIILDIQKYLVQTMEKWQQEKEMDNILSCYRQSWKASEIFTGNGFLSSLKTFESKNELLTQIGLSSYFSTELAVIYLKSEVSYKNTYFSLDTKEIQDFKNQEIQTLHNIMEVFKNYQFEIFELLNSDGELWNFIKTELDKINPTSII